MPRGGRAASGALVLLALAACGGGGGGGGGGAPTSLTYADDPAAYRVGAAIAANAPSTSGGQPTAWSVAPPLPAGLALDPATGVITGVPQVVASTATYVVTASNGAGQAQHGLSVQVTPALPATMLSLAPGFEAVVRWPSLNAPVRMAFAPDGRLFFNELFTGVVRVIDAQGVFQTTPVATISVLTGNHNGLLGLALAPDFATSNELFVFASVPASGIHADRNQVLKVTLAGNVASSVTVLIDDLPIGSLQDGGELRFGPEGHLYVSLGDTDVASLAQQAGVLPGRVLRYTRAGGIPADNPIVGSPEWCRGLRNTFGMTFHPTLGGLFGVENGPATNDELNYLQKGKDYGWPNPVAGGGAGLKLYGWPEVIAPTSLTFYTGGGFGPGYDDNLFLTGYVNEDLHRLPMSGVARTDVDADLVFAKWVTNGVTNKPLHVVVGPDGALYVATFDAIYRIRKSP